MTKANSDSASGSSSSGGIVDQHAWERAHAMERIARQSTEADELGELGPWSTGEKLAVCLVLGRLDWLEQMHYTVLEAVDRLGEVWLSAAIRVERDRRNT